MCATFTLKELLRVVLKDNTLLSFIGHHKEKGFKEVPDRFQRSNLQLQPSSSLKQKHRQSFV